MLQYNLAIVDSDDFHISMMRRNLAAYTHKYGVQFNINIFVKALDFLQQLPNDSLDLCIISMVLPDLPDTLLAERLYELKLSTPMILCSTNAEHAYHAYKNAASGFLLKPVIFDDLEELLNRLLPLLYVHMKVPNNTNSILVKRDGRPFYVLTKDIYYFEKFRNKLFIFTDNYCYHTYYTIRDLIRQLNPKQFVQIHQGCLVNWEYVDRIENQTIILGPHRLTISKAYYKSVLFQEQMYPLDRQLKTHYRREEHQITAAEEPCPYISHTSVAAPADSTAT